MSLSECAAWQHEILEGAPVRLDPEAIVVPANAEVDFIAMEHGNTSNADYLADALADADIFFPEIIGWDPLTAKYLQKVSKGDYKARQRVLEGSESTFLDFTKQLVDGMYNSRVAICMADLPHTSPIPAKLLRVGYTTDGLNPDAYPLMAERDRHIARTIGLEIGRLQDENPRLGDKVVKATALFGVGHMSVAAALSEAARLQGVDTFSARLLFPPDSATSTSRDIIDYNNWLQTAE